MQKIIGPKPFELTNFWLFTIKRCGQGVEGKTEREQAAEHVHPYSYSSIFY